MSSRPIACVEITSELLTVSQVARLTSLGTRTIARHWRMALMPAPRRIGGAVRWSRAEIADWIAGGCRPVDGKAGAR